MEAFAARAPPIYLGWPPKKKVDTGSGASPEGREAQRPPGWPTESGAMGRAQCWETRTPGTR